MIAHLFVVSAMLLATAQAAAATADPAPLQPNSKWVVDFADNMCVLLREYGTAEEPATLTITPQPMREDFVVGVYSAETDLPNYNAMPVKVGLGSGPPAKDVTLTTFNLRSRDLRYNGIYLEREEIERAAANGLISIDAKEELSVAFEVGGLGSALHILDECLVDLLADWDFSRERQQAMASPPEPIRDIRRYVRPSEYPTEAMLRNEMGINSARFTVDRDGRTSDCTIVESSGSRRLDRNLCRLIQRIRYHPATDVAGQPMDSIGYVRFQWWLE